LLCNHAANIRIRFEIVWQRKSSEWQSIRNEWQTIRDDWQRNANDWPDCASEWPENLSTCETQDYTNLFIFAHVMTKAYVWRYD